MIRLVRGEFIKLRTTRTALGFAAAMALLTLALVLLGILAGDPKTAHDKLDAVSVGATISILLLFFGVVGAGAEYRHRTLAPALLIAPDRARLLAARMFAYGVAGLVIGAIALAVTFAIGLPLLASQPGPDLAASDYWLAIGGGLVACGLCAMLGVGAGALIAKQVPAVIGAMVYIFILEPLVNLVSKDATKFTIGQTSGAVAGSGSGEQLAWTRPSSCCSPGRRCSRSPRPWWTAGATSPSRRPRPARGAGPRRSPPARCRTARRRRDRSPPSRCAAPRRAGARRWCRPGSPGRATAPRATA